jgi:Endonuclease/Exonuclease/phosphatase family
VKIVTFNINDINKRLESLLTWLAKSKPDVVCLQELKAEKGAFPGAGASKPGVRSSLGRRAFMQRRGNSVAKPQSCSDALSLAWEVRGSPSALHRGRGEWDFDCFHLPP